MSSHSVQWQRRRQRLADSARTNVPTDQPSAAFPGQTWGGMCGWLNVKILSLPSAAVVIVARVGILNQTRTSRCMHVRDSFAHFQGVHHIIHNNSVNSRSVISNETGIFLGLSHSAHWRCKSKSSDSTSLEDILIFWLFHISHSGYLPWLQLS